MDHDIFDEEVVGARAITPKTFCTTDLDKKRVTPKINLEQTVTLE